MTEKEAIKLLSDELKVTESVIGFEKEFENMSKRVLEWRMRRAKGIKMAIKALEEIQQYREIGTVERYRVMAYKMKPEKPIKATNKYSNVYACPCCGYILIHKDETGWFCGRKYKFCPECAKNIDWSEKE